MDYNLIIGLVLSLFLGGFYIITGIRHWSSGMFYSKSNPEKYKTAHKIYHIAMGLLVIGSALWWFFSELLSSQ